MSGSIFRAVQMNLYSVCDCWRDLSQMEFVMVRGMVLELTFLTIDTC
jgi:hypothetical protein